MNKAGAVVITLTIVALAISTPIFIAIQQAKTQALEGETKRALAYAHDILQRSDDTADQAAAGIAELVAAHAPDPCSGANIAIMRQIDLASSYLQTIGYVKNERLMCSSLGRHGEGLLLGPPDLVTSRGTIIRRSVAIPLASGSAFIVLERQHYAVIIHKNLPIDATTDEANVSLATFALDDTSILTARGEVRPEWIARLGNSSQATFVDHGYVVAVVKSRKYKTAALAAVPAAYLGQRVQALALLLVPIGLAAGIMVALAVLYLARQQQAMPAVLKVALRRNEFFLVYQPVVDLRTGQWVGAEALIRWRRANGELIRPDIFIRAAEDAGIIQRITQRVTEILARDAADLFRLRPDFHIAINLSPLDLTSAVTVELLRGLATVLKAGPHNLIVEATERGLMQVQVAREVIRGIRSSGVRVAIDDFGTGYSSLSYLQTLDFDFLKIDKSFVDAIGTEAPTNHVVLHIIQMAKDLKLETIAEGVETESQAQFLREHDVGYAQGWLFAKPMAYADLIRKLVSQKPN